EIERGKSYEVIIEMKNESHHVMHFRFMDGIPQSFSKPFPLKSIVKGKSTAEIKYETEAPVRGKYQIDRLYLRYTSNLGLWEKQKA
ncbi:hypothetical protein, partial [Pseudomonas sp. 2822-15]|uniref:hypothetical protein n=1 Tax=Pseudomonas sp. 2822-15 TaxID=1712677 RepID=UPI001C45B63A